MGFSGNGFRKVLVLYPVDYQGNFPPTYNSEKHCIGLYMPTNDPNPNANKTKPIVVLIVLLHKYPRGARE
jgi:hypothetical protein